MLPQPGLRAVNLQKVRLLDRIAARNSGLANEIRNLKLDWYAMKNVADDDEKESHAEVYIYDEIGGSFGTNAMDFIDELNEISAPEIVVRINSPGGLLVDAIAISSALAQHPSKITTRVDGIAASAASLIAVSGDVCEMMTGSQMMVHDVLCGVQGNAADMREAAKWLDNQSENVANIYARKTKGDPKEWRSRMLAETWMFAEEAVEFGLADSVYERIKDFTVKEMPPEEDDDVEPEESMDPEKEMPEKEDDDSEESKALAALDFLMHRKHRMTNRGYKYLSRNAAPAPLSARNISEDEMEEFISKLSKLGGKK
jgi:ATP-dependent protease ClpP protease subunit